MTDLKDARVAVIGAGVFGLSIAAEVTARGARCVVIDPEIGRSSASAVAAGMLAPAFESALEGKGAGWFPLLRHARDRWPAFAERHRLPLPARAGAVWFDPTGARPVHEVAAALSAAGARFELLRPEELAAMSVGLAAASGDGAFTPEDWTIDPAPALGALYEAVARNGGSFLTDPATAAGARVVSAGSERLEVDAVVLCPGPGGGALAAAAPELALLRPIKGQILRFDGAAPSAAPTIRSPGGYLVPSRAGPLVGATMEEGREDLRATPEAERRLREAAEAMCPHLRGAPTTVGVGVRAAAPDGLPLVGRSVGGVWLAAGARRNGWLLAPLVAQTVASALAGDGESALAQTLRPDRFA